MRCADYIADFLVKNNINTNFSVPGGGSMHLNDAFSHKKGLKTVFVQHEQAGAIASECYNRFGKLSCVTCTTGPGGTNTLTGVLGAWLDSIPLFVISGQVRIPYTVSDSKIPLRQLGDQEFNITETVKNMTKYSVMVTNPLMISYHLEKALYLASASRPGPVWIDVPLDIQSCDIDESKLIHFDPGEIDNDVKSVSTDTISKVIEMIKASSRPVFNAGNGIRIGGAVDEFKKAIDKLDIPTVVGFDCIDLIEENDRLYCGRAGLLGNRSGNFTVQNSDLVISVGSRLSVRQVGYNKENWAKNAKVIVVDVDDAELLKPTFHSDLRICCDAKTFLTKLLDVIDDKKINFNNTFWLKQCKMWQEKYPVVLERHKAQVGKVNLYNLMDKITDMEKEGQITVVGNGSACVASSQAFRIKQNQRYIMNSGCASMGYGLPASIGACFANIGKTIVCLTGEGSISMNIQELQTVYFHRLPIKIVVINNSGYHSMRQTENNLFPNSTKFGIGEESGDLSFVNLKKISDAYGIPYMAINENNEVESKIKELLSSKSQCICEVFVDTEQNFEPRIVSKRDDKGHFLPSRLEDMYPFLPKEELDTIMKVGENEK